MYSQKRWFAICSTGFAICLMIFAFLSKAQARVPINVFSTGISNDGAALPQGSVDPHYQLIWEPGSTDSEPTYVTAPPNALWDTTGTGSQWIAPVPPQNVWYNTYGYMNGFYDYQTTFDLTGMNPQTAVLNGQAMADDVGWAIFVNGQSISPWGNAFGGYTGFGSFTISGNTPTDYPAGPKFVQFLSGINKLDFIAENIPNYGNGLPGGPSPTGLRVQISGTASPIVTPESSSMELLGFAAPSYLIFMRRRRRKHI